MQPNQSSQLFALCNGREIFRFYSLFAVRILALLRMVSILQKASPPTCVLVWDDAYRVNELVVALVLSLSPAY